MSAAATGNLLRSDNITLPGAPIRPLGMGVLVAGAVAALAVLGMGFTGAAGVTLKHALAVYHVGAMGVLAMCLGSLFFVMVFHLMGAGWSIVLRRQLENIASFLPFAWLLVMPVLVIELVTQGTLFIWMKPVFYADYLLQKKAAYFFAPLAIVDHDTHEAKTTFVFPAFFAVRALFYGGVWTLLSRRMVAFGRAQEARTDLQAASKARFTSAWGLLLFALTTAFASFDWLMSLDFKFFSTMWPVWYFAGCAFSGISLLVLIVARLKAAGRLQGVVTSEHFHDTGKLVFSFTVFWSYIAFSQYFLIWYSNIPEETAFFFYRTNEGSPWRPLGIFLIIGHFAAPFLVGLFRPVKRSPMALGLLAAWALFVHFADLYYVVRPMVETAGGGPIQIARFIWVDVIAIAGVFAILIGYLLMRIPATPLVSAKDPLIEESLEHRNYV
ncbi:MAG: hypothetical protein SFY69_06490 [Planctomycetota bacterium]|nr:hypothetical protein [Planctomycetota bacterium]